MKLGRDDADAVEVDAMVVEEVFEGCAEGFVGNFKSIFILILEVFLKLVEEYLIVKLIIFVGFETIVEVGVQPLWRKLVIVLRVEVFSFLCRVRNISDPSVTA